MIKRLIDQVADAIASRTSAEAGTEGHEAALRMATAVLMVEVARADHVFDESEFDRLLSLIEAHFELSPEEAAELVNAASDKAENLTSVHDFTQRLHESLDEADKARIIALLWQIAYADGRLDKYEDSLVLKISDLLYVSRGRVMRLKHDAQHAARQAR
ncbi:MAG: TerB family tellurite resistance protein [Gammaproteobacteria bacterium]|nr:TerB family tellurite resistance protein [Gammaproteobacteria bacterium]MDH3373475.1 TerB family tellurite resistance protein [Gammaproteobacteria bacterium]MDH3408676.1 TerB family tellurite resistance protein [Gammaproteobacteria bacterium]MDH3553977.1 TerB family tellurite resistance protein [Gammaproteobacteria bacterium]